MNCNYIIKMPDGGILEIPSAFGLVSVLDENLKDLYDNSSLDDYNKLASYLEEKHGEKTNINTINSIIEKNLTTLSDGGSLEGLVADMNDVARSSTSLTTFEAALSDYIMRSQDEDSTAMSPEQIKENLESPVHIKYFSDLSAVGLIGSTSIEKEHKSVKDKIGSTSGKGNGLLHRLDTFFEVLKDSEYGDYGSNVLLKNQSPISLSSSTIGEYSMFQDGSYESLFLSAFKRVANNINKASQQLPENFFTTTIDSAGHLLLSPFEEHLVNNSESDRAIVETVLNMVVNGLDGGDWLLKDIRDIFVYLNPGIYVLESTNNKLLAEQFLKDEYVFEREFQDKQLTDVLTGRGSNLDAYFLPVQRTTSEDVLEELLNKVTLNQDLVKISPKENYTTWIIPSNIKLTRNGKQIYITGKTYSGNKDKGTITLRTASAVHDVNHIFEYRKFDGTSDPAEDDADLQRAENHVTVQIGKDGSYIDPLFLRNIVQKGDVVGGKMTTNKEGKSSVDGGLTVVGVYPNQVAVSKEKGKVTTINYSNIQVLHSSKLAEESDKLAKLNLLEFSRISPDNMAIISKGDIIKVPGTDTYRQVLHADASLVHVYAPKKDGTVFLQAIPKSDIKEASVHSSGRFTNKEMASLTTTSNRINYREASMSEFYNKHMAKDGDYFVGKLPNGDLAYGRIEDSTNNKVLYLSKIGDPIRGEHLDNLTDLKFYTNRVISSTYSASILRVNSWRIRPFEHDSDNIPKVPEGTNAKTFVPVRYVVPKDTDISKLYLLPGNYLNIGKYVDDTYKIPATEVNVTETVRNLMIETNQLRPNQKLYVEQVSEHNRYYKRDMKGLNRIVNFNTLPTDTKHALNPLKNGVYFSVNKKSTMGSEIYRVVSSTDTEVTAHLNKINDEGKLLTFVHTFKKEDLLRGRQPGDTLDPEGSIANLYMQYNNKNMEVIVDAVENSHTPEQATKNTYIAELANAMRITFKPLGIDVELDRGVKSGDSLVPSQFQEGQRAKIETFEKDGIPMTKIVLNTLNGDYSDLVHENLHIFLTLLRYSSAENYDKLITTVLTNSKLPNAEEMASKTLPEREEKVVDMIVEFTKGTNTFLNNDLFSVMNELQNVMRDNFEEDFKFSFSKLNNNALTFLNQRITDLYKIDANNNANPFFNMSLITMEPRFRKWMQDYNVQLNCK